MRAALAGKTWDVVIADYHLPGFDAPEALATLHDTGLDLPFIVVSGTMGEDVAVGMMRSGAHDYLIKDHLARLAPAVEREVREAHIRQERKQAEESLRLALIAAEEANHRYHLGRRSKPHDHLGSRCRGIVHLCQPRIRGGLWLSAPGIDRQEAFRRYSSRRRTRGVQGGRTRHPCKRQAFP